MQRDSRQAAPSSARRDFLKLVADSAGALVIATCVPLIGRRSEAGEPEAGMAPPPIVRPDPQAFIRIDRDGTVTLISKHLEMGQGVLTGLATLVADELGVEWSRMRYQFAPADLARYAHTQFGMQSTGGSSSMSESWQQLRLAAAACRQMLLGVAAQRWSLPAATLSLEQGIVRDSNGSRRATIGSLATAAAALPIPDTIALKPAAQYRLIGTPRVPRIDGAEKTTGRTRYGLDVRRPGMLRAVIARPPRAGGTLKSFDASAARAIKGVIDVLPVPAGVAVIARDSWTAMRARETLRIEWDDSSAEQRSSAQILADYQRTPADAGTSVTTRGDAAAGLARAATVIEAEYAVPLLAHAPMEPLNVTVELGESGADLWGGFQMTTLDQAAAAKVLGLAPEQVRLHHVPAGGSFGRRTNQDYVIEAASVARALGRRAPVQLLWTRTDDLTSGYYRPAYLHRLRGGLDASGKLLAWNQQVIGPSIVTGTEMAGMMRNGIDPTSVAGASDNFYDIPELRLALVTTPSLVKLSAWRSVGHTHTGFAMESFIDELAHAAAADPLAFRLAMLTQRPDLVRLLELVAEKSGWHQALGAGRGRGLAVRHAFNTRIALVAEVTANADDAFTLDRVVCTVDCGIAINPDMIAAQIEGGIGWGLGAALQNAITLQDGRVEQRNFDGYAPLRMAQMPKVEVHIVPSQATPTGVGEPGVTVIAPALANAIFAATGRRRRQLPLR